MNIVSCFLILSNVVVALIPCLGVFSASCCSLRPNTSSPRPGLLQLFRSTRSREGSNERELSVSFDSASVSSYSSDFVEPAIAVSVSYCLFQSYFNILTFLSLFVVLCIFSPLFLQENVSVMEDLVMTFMLLLFQIWHKRNDTEYKPDLAASVVRLPKRVNDSQPSQVNG